MYKSNRPVTSGCLSVRTGGWCWERERERERAPIKSQTGADQSRVGPARPRLGAGPSPSGPLFATSGPHRPIRRGPQPVTVNVGGSDRDVAPSGDKGPSPRSPFHTSPGPPLKLILKNKEIKGKKKNPAKRDVREET